MMEAARITPAARAARAKRWQGAMSYGVLLLVTVLVTMPLVWMFVTSIKTNSEYLAYPIKFLPEVAQWINYLEVFNVKYHFLRHAGITVLLALTFATLSVLSSSLVGYAFARFPDVKGQQKLFSIIIAMLIIPGIVTIIPQFVLFSRLHLTGSYWPWILWGLTGSPFHIFLFRQFFLGFPRELEDAAEVDGCTAFSTYWRIFLPNAKPAIATSFILNFVWVWGDWFTALIYLPQRKTTLPVILENAFSDPKGFDLTTLTIAAVTIYIIPMIVTFFLGQNYIVKGVVTSGLKG